MDLIIFAFFILIVVSVVSCVFANFMKKTMSPEYTIHVVYVEDEYYDDVMDNDEDGDERHIVKVTYNDNGDILNVEEPDDKCPINTLNNKRTTSLYREIQRFYIVCNITKDIESKKCFSLLKKHKHGL